MNTIQNRDSQVNEIEPINTIVMKMKLRIKDKVITATPDTSAAMSIISNSLVKELGLLILPINPIKVQALNNITTMIEVIDEPPLKIQQAVVPVTLRVVKSLKPILLLEMDWHTKHAVVTNVGNNTLDFTAQGQRYQTVIEYGQTPTIDNVECFSVIRVVEGSEDSEEQAGWSPALPLANEVNEESSPKEEPLKERLRKELLAKFPRIIFTDEKHATITDRVQCKIYMKNDRPIRSGIRPLGFYKREWLRKEVDKLLKAGVIRPSRSPYAAAPVIVKKKDGSWRFAVDYREGNKNSDDFLYPLPKIAELFDCFAGAKWFTTLDLARGYWQIAMHSDSIKYTSFITPFGQYEFLVMPFGLKQASGWFQLLMNEVLRPVLGKFALVYLDDI